MGKGFKRGQHQLDHIKTHTGVRPHQCQHCLKRFLTKSSIKDMCLRTQKGARVHVKFVENPLYIDTGYQAMLKLTEVREALIVSFVDWLFPLSRGC